MEGASCAVLQAVNETLLVAWVGIFWNGNVSSCALLQPVLDGSGAAWGPGAGSVLAILMHILLLVDPSRAALEQAGMAEDDGEAACLFS